MDGRRLLALVAALAGVTLLVAGALQGDVRFALLLILPVLIAEGPLPALGIALLIVAAVLAFLARAASRPPEAWEAARDEPPETEPARHGGVVFVGPIPIVWGSDRRIARWMVVAAAVLAVAIVVLLTWGRR